MIPIRRILRFWVPIAVFGLTTVGVGVSTIQASSDAVPIILGGQEEDRLPGLDRLRSKLAQIADLHYKYIAVIEIQPEASPAKTGGGWFEYWGSGEKFRVDNGSEPHLGLAPSLTWAFDGTRRYLYDPTRSVLDRAPGDPSHLSTTLPNPMLLPFDFLSDEAPDCRGCRLRLRDLGNGELWSRKMAAGGRTAGEARLHRMEVPGQGRDGEKFRYSVREVVAGDGLESVSVERRTLLGELISRVDADFVSVTGRGGDRIDVPALIRAQRWDTRRGSVGPPDMSMELYLEEIEVGVALDDSTFRLDPSIAETVFDGAQRKFVKVKGRRVD